MVINTKPQNSNLLRKTGSKISGGGGAPAPPAASALHADQFVVKAARDHKPGNSGERPIGIPEDEADDVIDLGAPRLLRRALASSPGRQSRWRSSYTPNPRLYPGPHKKPLAKKSKRAEGRGRRRKRVYKRPVPNARLYRPAPPRPSPPPPSPWRGGSWPPPAPTQPALATASIAALQLTQTRPETHAPSTRRLVVTLPAQRNTMDHVPRNSEEGSDGNDPASAPSEFLAEFLSAIMQRQYSEALKYCRLILQYEPHNATARGFYSLLQHKVSAAPAAAPPTPPTPPSPVGRSPGYTINLNCEPRLAGSSSADSSPVRPLASPARRRRPRLAVGDVAMGSSHEGMEQEADESTSSSSMAGARAAAVAVADAARRDVSPATRDVSPSRSDSGSETDDDSCASQSSLELDSSPSLSLSRRTDHTDSASGSGAGWVSSGTPPSSGSGAHPPDDNGNAPPTPEPRVRLHADDMQNDNDHTSPLKSTSSSETLRRLRAQFTCSIK